VFKRRFDGTKAEEYGSHDKTFQMTADGVVRVTDTEGNVLMEQPLKKNIFRMSGQRRSHSRLGKTSCKQGACYKRTYYILVDENRAHDRKVIEK
jgi:isocitrate dehydrogenase